jgi:hypothetical protein
MGVKSFQDEVARFMFDMLPGNVEKLSSDLATVLAEEYSAAQLLSEQSLTDAIDQILYQPAQVAVKLLGSIISAISPQRPLEAQTLQLHMIVQTIKKLLTTHAASGFASTAQQMLLLVPQAVSAMDAPGAAALLDVLKSASCNPSDGFQASYHSGVNDEVCQSASQLSETTDFGPPFA